MSWHYFFFPIIQNHLPKLPTYTFKKPTVFSWGIVKFPISEVGSKTSISLSHSRKFWTYILFMSLALIPKCIPCSSFSSPTIFAPKSWRWWSIIFKMDKTLNLIFPTTSRWIHPFSLPISYSSGLMTPTLNDSLMLINFYFW